MSHERTINYDGAYAITIRCVIISRQRTSQVRMVFGRNFECYYCCYQTDVRDAYVACGSSVSQFHRAPYALLRHPYLGLTHDDDIVRLILVEWRTIRFTKTFRNWLRLTVAVRVRRKINAHDNNHCSDPPRMAPAQNRWFSRSPANTSNTTDLTNFRIEQLLVVIKRVFALNVRVLVPPCGRLKGRTMWFSKTEFRLKTL